MATTITTIAADYDMQVPEVTAALDLGRDYDEHAELGATTEATYREALDIMAEHAAELDTTTITVQLVQINRQDVVNDKLVWFDKIAIRRDGELIDFAWVPSSEAPEPYDAAVRAIIGDEPFEWVD